MASPEVCRALPTMTWFTSSGATPLRESAPFAANTARSMAVMSLNEPLYSAIGVRAPSRMTMSFIGLGSFRFSKCLGQLHAEVLHEEGHLVGGFLDLLCGRDR